MKWFIVPALAASMFSVHASHHAFQGHHQNSHSKVDIARELGLTAAQQTKFKELRFTFLKHVFQGVHDDSIDFSQHEKSLEHVNEQIKGILTKDQFEKLEKQGGVHAVLDMQLAHEELFARLNADEAQLTRLRNLMKETHKTMEKIQSHGLPAAETHAKMKEAIKSALNQMKAILTPEQLKKAFELIGGKA